MIAGCTANPFDSSSGQEGPVTVIANNSATATYTFEIYVIESPPIDPELSITRRNGMKDTLSTDGGLTVTDLAGDDRSVVSVKFPQNQSRLHERYSVPPTAEKLTNITEFKSYDTVVIVIRDDERIHTIVTADCDDDLVIVEGYIGPNGGAGGYNCE
ncbi:hypothetical protein [Halogeometricum limi]|uniref:hypothetical protein n=1 Tax=Halogeometricum limi TaxID=555875 RepID=UPI00111460DD|nr:hypothetical protein [Halogeometricum limi]